MPEIRPHSFDHPIDRAAPSSFIGSLPNGQLTTIVIDVPTLIVAIKPRCDGCRDFIHSPLTEFEGLRVVVVSATRATNGEWDDALQTVVVAPEFLSALDVRWPPCYVLVDPQTHRVVLEGVVFGPSQVAQEIERHHTR